MPALADLLDPDTVARLAGLRAEAEQREQATASVPVLPVCPTCGARRPTPAAVFRDGTEPLTPREEHR